MEKERRHVRLFPCRAGGAAGYRWDGNVRELANLVEYLSLLGRDPVEAEDLPDYLRASAPALPQPAEPAAARPSGRRPGAGKRLPLPGVRAGPLRRRAGRGALLEQARQQGVPLTEQQVRDILWDLNRLGLVSVSRGRGGSRLTRAGLELWERLDLENKMGE